jgi:hypothetical protein
MSHALRQPRLCASPVELTMLAWYGHAEPDVVAEFEAENNVKFKPKYYTGGDNMLGLIAQSPPGTFDVILSDAEYVQQLNARPAILRNSTRPTIRFDDYFPNSSSSPATGRTASCSRGDALRLPRRRLQHRRPDREGSHRATTFLGARS